MPFTLHSQRITSHRYGGGAGLLYVMRCDCVTNACYVSIPLLVEIVYIKALRGAGFGPQGCGSPGDGILYLLRGGAGCGLDFVFVAGRCGLRARPVRCGPGCGPGYVKNMRGGAGCGPNDTVAGRVRAQLFQPAQFKFSQNLHIACVY